MSTRTLLIVSIVLAMSVSAYGQYPSRHKKQQGPAAGPTPAGIDGTVDGPCSGGIRISTAGNQMVMVLVVPDSQVHVVGDAEPDYIQKNKCVEFTAHVEKDGEVKEKVTRLTVVTPTADKPCGLSSSGGNGPSSDDMFSGTTTKEAPAEKHKKPKVARVKLPGDYLVRGYVKSCNRRPLDAPLRAHGGARRVGRKSGNQGGRGRPWPR